MTHGKELGWGNLVLTTKVEYRESCVTPNAEALSGSVTHQLHQLFKAQNACFNKSCIKNREGGLDTHDSHGALLKSARLFLRRVGRMVGGDHIDRTVEDSLQYSLSVIG